MFGALKRGFRSMVSLILVRNVVGEHRPKRTLTASRGFLAAARLSCSHWRYLVRRAYATVLLLSVYRLSSVNTKYIVATWGVLEQKLLLTAYRKSYEKSIGTKMNDLDLCLEP